MPILNPQEAFYSSWEAVQKNRFVLNIEGIPSFAVQAVSVPTPTSNVIVLDHINVQQKIKGKTTWSNFNFSIYNMIAPSTMQMVWEWLRLSHESSSGRDSYQDIYKKSVFLDVLSPALETVSRYHIVGCWISSISGQDFDKSADGLVNINVTCECDYCELEF
jgi:T4-like virus tail tube protein gp19